MSASEEAEAYYLRQAAWWQQYAAMKHKLFMHEWAAWRDTLRPAQFMERMVEHQQACRMRYGTAQDYMDMAALVRERDRAVRERDECSPYLKDGETPAQRIARLHGEISGMMKTLAVYTDRAFAAETALTETRAALAEANERAEKIEVEASYAYDAMQRAIRLSQTAADQFSKQSDEVIGLKLMMFKALDMPLARLGVHVRKARAIRATLANLETQETRHDG